MTTRSAVLDFLTTSLRTSGISDIRPVPKGVFSSGWRVTSNDGLYFVKVNDDPEALEQFSTARAAAELAGRHGIPAPQVLACGRGASGHVFAVQEWLDGTDLEDHLATFGPDERARVFGELGALLARLHSIVPTDQEPKDVHELYLARLEEYRGRIARCGAMEPAALDTLAARLAELIPAVMPAGPARLCHRDLHPPNVLVRPDGGLALLDLDFAKAGHPAEDFVKLEWWAFAVPEDAEAFYTAYRTHRASGAADVVADVIGLHKLIIALSYVGFIAERAPEELAHWRHHLDTQLRQSGHLLRGSA